MEIMMETTPTNRCLRPRHVPTPKLSERKKKLFQDAKETSTTILINNVIDEGDENSDLGPMSPLQFSSSPSSFQRLHSNSKGRFMNKNIRTDFKNIFANISPTSTPTHANNKTMDDSEDDGVTPLCTSMKKMTSVSELDTVTSLEPVGVLEKDNYAQQLRTPNDLCTSGNTPEQLLRGISFRKSLIFDTGLTPHDDITPSSKASDVNDNTVTEPKAKTSLTFSEPLISVKSFYGSSLNNDLSETKKSDNKLQKIYTTIIASKPKVTRKVNTKKPPRVKAPTLWHHGGVFKRHKPNKIKMQQKLKANNPKKNKMIAKGALTSENLVQVSDKSNVVKKPNEDDTMNEKNKRLQRILREQTNAGNQVRSINWNVGGNVSSNNNKGSFYASDDDDDEQSDDDDENNVPAEKETDEEKQEDDSVQTNRKFFKSKATNTAKKYCIISGIHATLKRGCDMKLERPAKRKKRSYVKREETVVLQNEITNIIDRLVSPSKSKNTDDDISSRTTTSPNIASTTQQTDNTICTAPIDGLLEQTSDEMDKYRKMIPYKTNDSKTISQQEAILELLILNGICNDETFKIFISEPDLHKEKADKIIDSLYYVTSGLSQQIDNNADMTEVQWTSNADIVESMPNTSESNMNIAQLNAENTDVFMSPASQISNMTSSLALHSTGEASSSAPLFPIFHKDYRPRVNRELFQNTPNPLKKWKPIGNQYQIDAGQKEFGIKTCPQCDMQYSVHEPEDEIMHIKYHNAIPILSFKGWVEENVVTMAPEWGINGRIIFICEGELNKMNRVNEVLSLVDRDLGFATLNWTPKTIVYFGIVRQQIAGVVVAQPITKAHRLITENGLDCCSVETYPAKVGLSRVWVAPPYRNYGIASKMIASIRGHFRFGDYLSYDDIAFSSPTEAGKKLAAKLAGRQDFLVYEIQQ